MSVQETELVFESAVDGLFHLGLRDRLQPDLREQLRQAGLDLSRPLLPAYPRKSWNHFLQLTVDALWPDAKPEVAYRALGKQMLAGYQTTLVGKALASLSRIIGPKRVLERMTHNLRSGANYNQCRTTATSPTEILFWVNEPYVHPSYFAGMLEATLELTGAKGVDIQVQEKNAEGCTYRICWQA